MYLFIYAIRAAMDCMSHFDCKMMLNFNKKYQLQCSSSAIVINYHATTCSVIFLEVFHHIRQFIVVTSSTYHGMEANPMLAM